MVLRLKIALLTLGNGSGNECHYLQTKITSSAPSTPRKFFWAIQNPNSLLHIQPILVHVSAESGSVYTICVHEDYFNKGTRSESYANFQQLDEGKFKYFHM